VEEGVTEAAVVLAIVVTAILTARPAGMYTFFHRSNGGKVSGVLCLERRAVDCLAGLPRVVPSVNLA
jgi:hypothetical protein